MRPAIAVLVLCVFLAADDFTWNWRSQEVIGKSDPSLNNTSKLTEPQRAELLSAIMARLEKPLADRGYTDVRIREIASTTRLRFVDLHVIATHADQSGSPDANKPLVFATSLGLEGGCDELVNCPFWIFRHQSGGYTLLVDTTAASYTIQPTQTNGYSDLVMSRHESTTETRLTLYKYDGNTYGKAACYTARFPAAKDGEAGGPEIEACSEK